MLGHPVHPVLVHFPVALLLSATIADLAYVSGLTQDTHIGAVLMAGGLAGGLLAMGAGMADLVKLDQKLVPHAMMHASFVGLAWLGYGIALYLRKDSLFASNPLGGQAIAVSLVSAVVLAFGGWLGGRLVYTFGANVAARGPAGS
ncbi:MAG TPA: DUF2231 domain-containing protein [Sphingomicrobium sp.]|jgi:uncharacterized membrane protein